MRIIVRAGIHSGVAGMEIYLGALRKLLAHPAHTALPESATVPAAATIVVVADKVCVRLAASHARRVTRRASARHSRARLRHRRARVATSPTVAIVPDEETGRAALAFAPRLSRCTTRRAGGRLRRIRYRLRRHPVNRSATAQHQVDSDHNPRSTNRVHGPLVIPT